MTPRRRPEVGRPRRSLDELRPSARDLGVRIALENLSAPDLPRLDLLLAEYEPELVGLCYDSGHGNLVPAGIATLRDHGRRLIAVHLHDNDGTGDQHLVPFDGTVEWGQVCDLIGRSAYHRCPSLEVSTRGYAGVPEREFLAAAARAGGRIATAFDGVRGG